MIDISILPSVEFRQKSKLPDVAGVYVALSEAGVSLYVGASRNLRQRWNSGRHHRMTDLQEHDFCRLAWVLVDEKDLGKTELQFIDELRPLLNSTTPLPYIHKRLHRIALVDTHIYFPVRVWAALKRLAKRNRRSLSAQIVIAVEQMIERENAKQ
jgi:hypothetical protein